MDFAVQHGSCRMHIPRGRVSNMVGRDKDIRTLLAEVCRRNIASRILIHGDPGVGEDSVAVEVVHHSDVQYSNLPITQKCIPYASMLHPVGRCRWRSHCASIWCVMMHTSKLQSIPCHSGVRTTPGHERRGHMRPSDHELVQRVRRSDQGSTDLDAVPEAAARLLVLVHVVMKA